MARVVKLTDEIRVEIAQLIRAGNTVDTAARTAGLSDETFQAWMERGKRAGKTAAPYREFRETIERARAETEALLVTRIAAAAQNGSWGAAAWILERRFPGRWAKPSKQYPPAEGETEEPSSPGAASFEALDELAERRGRTR